MAKLIATRTPFYYGWVHVFLAAAAMVATLPGRSVGIGLITEPLLKDLSVERLTFGAMNFWATLIGASFNLVCGRAVDHFGVRTVATAVLLSLSLIVLAFGKVSASVTLLIALVLVRGFGQSALSVVSLTIVGKWFIRRLSVAMAVFSVLVALGFTAAIVIAENSVLQNGWRATWTSLSVGIAVLAVLIWLSVRRNPESAGLSPDGESSAVDEKQSPHMQETKRQIGFTLLGALKQPAFWVFAVGSALYNLVIAGVLLFNQSILQQLGFDETVFRNAMAVFMFSGLAGNFLAGWLGKWWSLARMMTITLLLVAGYLVAFAFLTEPWHALLHAGALGVSGGVVSVLFFTVFPKAFGRLHLGKIQGAAQIFTVFASAIGPWLLAWVFDTTGSYSPAFWGLAPLIIIVAVLAWWTKVPSPEQAMT